MKLRILSDLHIDYCDLQNIAAIKQGDEDVVVCAGDVSNMAQRSLAWLRMRFPDKRIVFVPGNHEYYGASIVEANDEMLEVGNGLGIDVLVNRGVKIDGRWFYGTTLWSDFKLHGGYEMPFSMSQAEKYVNDFRLIKVDGTRLLSAWYVLNRLFAEAHGFLVNNLQAVVTETEKPPVVVTHFAPCTKSVAKRFEGDPVTPYRVNNLDHLVAQAPLWIHGHCHTPFDYKVFTKVAGENLRKESRVVCNPSGYRGEGAKFNPELMVEV